MGPPDRFEARVSWDYWVLPGGITLSIRPSFYSSIGIVFGPIAVQFNWGPYMQVNAAR